MSNIPGRTLSNRLFESRFIFIGNRFHRELHTRRAVPFCPFFFCGNLRATPLSMRVFQLWLPVEEFLLGLSSLRLRDIEGYKISLEMWWNLDPIRWKISIRIFFLSVSYNFFFFLIRQDKIRQSFNWILKSLFCASRYEFIKLKRGNYF